MIRNAYAMRQEQVAPVWPFFQKEGGRPYFSLEFVTGGTLADKIVATRMTCEVAAVLVESLARESSTPTSKGSYTAT